VNSHASEEEGWEVGPSVISGAISGIEIWCFHSFTTLHFCWGFFGSGHFTFCHHFHSFFLWSFISWEFDVWVLFLKEFLASSDLSNSVLGGIFSVDVLNFIAVSETIVQVLELLLKTNIGFQSNSLALLFSAHSERSDLKPFFNFFVFTITEANSIQWT
jgi:hypothetical protein